MRFVEDDCVVLGQDAASCCDVREVERVVRDHQIRLSGAIARSLGEASPDERAAPARAPVAADCKLGPQALRRLDLELCAVARLGRVEPWLHRLPRASVASLGEQERLEPLQLATAEVVLAPLDDGDVEIASKRGRRNRHVVTEQLFLQRLRRRCHDDPQPRLERRQQVGEALPDAGPGFGDEVPACGERSLHGVCQGGLLGPRLEAGQDLRERAADAEVIGHGRSAYASERMFSLRPVGRKIRSERLSPRGRLDGAGWRRLGSSRRIR